MMKSYPEIDNLSICYYQVPGKDGFSTINMENICKQMIEMEKEFLMVIRISDFNEDSKTHGKVQIKFYLDEDSLFWDYVSEYCLNIKLPSYNDPFINICSNRLRWKNKFYTFSSENQKNIFKTIVGNDIMRLCRIEEIKHILSVSKLMKELKCLTYSPDIWVSFVVISKYNNFKICQIPKDQKDQTLDIVKDKIFPKNKFIEPLKINQNYYFDWMDCEFYFLEIFQSEVFISAINEQIKLLNQ